MAEKKSQVSNNPFLARINAPAKSDFDKYYLDVSEKEVFKEIGIDDDGEKIGVSEKKFIVKKVDINEFLESQRDTVGVESYMKALAIQGVSADDFFSNVDLDKVQDFTDAPDNKFDGVLYGKKAVQLFEKLDPALKGSHTTIEGFLNSLSQDKIDAYIKGKVEAAFPVDNKGD